MPFLETISMFHKIKFSDSYILYLFQIGNKKIQVHLTSLNFMGTQLKARAFNAYNRTDFK